MKIPTVTQEIASTVYPQEYVAYSRENFVTRTHVEMVTVIVTMENVLLEHIVEEIIFLITIPF